MVRRKDVRTSIVIAGALLLFGCPGEEPPPDGGSRDGGPDRCANANADGGGIVIGACNATDGTRCDITRNLTCKWNLSTDQASCRCLSEPLGINAPCDPQNDQCDSGHACIQLAGDPEPVCYKVCSYMDGVGCDEVRATDPATAYACAPLRVATGDLTREYGICFGVGTTCDPFADQCPSDQACGLVGRVPACRPLGTRAIGQECSDTDQCVRGAVCVPLVDANGRPLGTRCWEPCRLEQPECTMGDCADVGLPIGLCFTP